MKKISIISIVLIPILAILASSALYTVNETQVAIKLRLGEVVSIEEEPGLKFKTPFVNNVVFFDQRIQTLDSAPETFRNQVHYSGNYCPWPNRNGGGQNLLFNHVSH